MNIKSTLLVLGLLIIFTTTYAQTYSLSGTASGANEVPPVTTNGTATISGTYNASTSTINLTVQYSGLSSGLSQAHLHAGPAGSNGPVIVNLNPTTGSSSGTISGSFSIPSSREAELIAGDIYLNIHTTNNPSGEIRSQVGLASLDIDRQLVINELDITNGWVELHNISDEIIDVSNLTLCVRPGYKFINELTILNGSMTMAPDSYLVISWPSRINSNNAEMAIYKARQYSNASNMIDYVKYRSAAPAGRVGVAVSAGLWDNTNNFVPLPTNSSRTLQNFNPAAQGGEDIDSKHWWDGAATQAMVNGCIDNYSLMNSTKIDGIESGNADYETDGILESEQIITSGSTVDYDSAQFIELLQNFEVVLGAEFLAFIDGCNAGQGGLN